MIPPLVAAGHRTGALADHRGRRVDAPFTRKQSVRPGDLREKRFRRGMPRLLGAGALGSVPLWRSYLDVAHPGVKPTDAGAQLAGVRCPVLVAMGTLDPDWADPHAEGSAIVDALPCGLDRL